MSGQQRVSRVLEKAQLRSARLKAINPKMDFGDACDLENMTQQIEKLRGKLETYNSAIAVVESTRAEIDEMEKSLGTLCERMLLGVGCRYGKDSSEYMMAGGTRKSDRIRKGTATRLKGAAESKSGEDTPTVE